MPRQRSWRRRDRDRDQDRDRDRDRDRNYRDRRRESPAPRHCPAPAARDRWWTRRRQPAPRPPVRDYRDDRRQPPRFQSPAPRDQSQNEYENLSIPGRPQQHPQRLDTGRSQKMNAGQSRVLKTVQATSSVAPVVRAESQFGKAACSIRLGSQEHQLDREKRKKRLRIYLIIGMIVSILIIAAVATGIAFAVKISKKADTEYNGPVAMYLDICRTKVQNDQCVITYPPKCNLDRDASMCKKFEFNLIDENGERKLIDRSAEFNVTNTNARWLCLRMSVSEWGVCGTSGEKTYCYPLGPNAAKGRQKISNLNDWLQDPAEWKDNCDELNPCWTSKARDSILANDGAEDFVDNTKKRDECKGRNMNECATAGVDAIVWLEHLRCKSGRNRTAYPEWCSGIPIRLWLCAKCEKKTPLCAGIEKTGCQYKCNGNDDQNTLPNGAECETEEIATGYCYHGYCFKVDKENPNEIMTKDECDQAKSEDQS